MVKPGLSYGNHLREAAGRLHQRGGDVFPVHLFQALVASGYSRQ